MLSNFNLLSKTVIVSCKWPFKKKEYNVAFRFERIYVFMMISFHTELQIIADITVNQKLILPLILNSFYSAKDLYKNDKGPIKLESIFTKF